MPSPRASKKQVVTRSAEAGRASKHHRGGARNATAEPAGSSLVGLRSDARSVVRGSRVACILPCVSLRNQPLRLALGQLNATVGDLDGNARKIGDMAARAREQGATLVVFPELALSGYPPEDLLLKPGFLEAARSRLEELAAATEGIVGVVGYPERADDVYNAAAVLADGRVVATYRKMFLPNYGVFDEHRYFQIGQKPALLELNGAELGLTICEDVWEPGPPATTEALAGAQLIVNLSASPYHAGKPGERERMLAQRARDSIVAVAFCNLVGGQDELVFDGMSAVIDERGEVLARAAQFDEELLVCTVDLGAVAAERLRDASHREAVRRERAGGERVARLGAVEVSLDGGRPEASGSSGREAAEAGGPRAEPLAPEAEIYAALVTGLRDYVEKNGFGGVVLGLSGGVDSALTAVVAVDALGPERVRCVVMPSRHSSQGTQEDARRLARNLEARVIELEIEAPMRAYEELLAEPFAGRDPDIAEENLQARIRGNLLMALSNKFGWLVLVTGNKSELSVGYSTLYGDMAGGFGPIKDLFKGWVYRVLRWRGEQAEGELLPPEIVARAPTAELRSDQRDEDDLPPYELLDRILAGYVEEDLDVAQLVRQGLPSDEVERVIAMVDGAEYKRRQAPPGIRISTKAFGRDRRLPITNRFGARAAAR
jgi:NAD+ synthase (glutamine-hydrolysing)